MFTGKSENQTTKDVVQQLLNQYIKQKLVSQNWKPEPYITSDSVEDSLRSDFFKEISCTTEGEPAVKYKVQIEVEFGNAASYYRDLFKFQRAFTNDEADVCILILPSGHLAGRIDSGLADYEKAIRELPDCKLSTTVPILVIGLFDDESDFDVKPYFYDSELVKKTSTNCVILRDRFLSSYIQKESVPETHLLKITKAYYEAFTKASDECQNLQKQINTTEKNIARVQRKIETQERNFLKSKTEKRKNTISQTIKNLNSEILTLRETIATLNKELETANEKYVSR